MRTSFIILLGCLVCVSVFGQSFDQIKKKDIEYVQNRASQYKSNRDKVERANFKGHFEGLEHRINRGYQKGSFVLEQDYNDFIENSFQKIFQSNSILKHQEFKHFIEKNNFPNAFSTGAYLYFITTGLFNYTDNEEQFIAVLCHEVAHDILKHSETSIIQQAEFEKDFKQEMRSLRKKDFIKLIKSQDEVMKVKYDLANQSRKKEIEADSLGYIFYKELGYDPNEYYNVLKNIENFDEEDTIEIQDSMYMYLFDLPGQVFKEKWLKIEKNDFFTGLTFNEHFDEDSIQSHPNVSDRLEWLHKKFNLSKDAKSKEPSELFSKLKEKTKNNFYQTFYDNEKYGIALYNLIYRLEENKENEIDNLNLGHIFLKLYEGRLDYKFNKYVPQIDYSSDDKGFQTFTSFLWNLSNNELKFIADYYTNKATE